MYQTDELFDLSHTLAGDYLLQHMHPWEALPGLRGHIAALAQTLDQSQYEQRSERVWVHRTALIAPTAYIGPDVIIGPRTEVRHCAFIRGSALIGEDCVVGNSVEIKNAILFDGVQVPHFNYVGDSILGYMAHMGAGAVTSNVRADKQMVAVRDGEQRIMTGMTKCGAMLGDYAEVGCNAVLNPGAIIGRGSIVYPLSCVRGSVPAGYIWKNHGRMERILR